MSVRIPNGWGRVSQAVAQNGAYLVYWYTDDCGGHLDDPEAYGTLKRWRTDVLERWPAARFVNGSGGREAWVPDEDADWYQEWSPDE